MSFEYLIDPEHGPQWKDLLPGSPEPYFLSAGEGEHAQLFVDLFTVLVSGNETDGQFGVFTARTPAGQLIPAHTHHGVHETFYVMEGSVAVYIQGRDGSKRKKVLGAGDFGFVPAGIAHSYQALEDSRLIGTSTGGFERFFQTMGAPTDKPGEPVPPFIPPMERMQAAGAAYNMDFLPQLDWSDAQE